MFIKYISIIIYCYHLHNVFSQSVTTQLKDNQILTSTLPVNGYNYYYFSSSSSMNQMFTKRDQPEIYLSVATCSQPIPPVNYHETIPSLNIYISTSNALPGSNDDILANNSVNGLMNWTSDGQTSEIWIAVGSPNLTASWNGNWTYEIGVSTSQFMHLLFVNNEEIDNDIPYITLDDTDRNHALFLSSPFQGSAPNSTILMTHNLPKELSYSLCAARLHKSTHYNVNTTVTYRGPTHGPKQQFMISNLTSNTAYTAYMLQTRGALIGMTTPIYLKTKMEANCRIIYDLQFCDQVAYSVPVNPDALLTSSIQDLVNQYDQQALEKFKPFDIALSQFNCETTLYSLVRNCTDCYRDYKTWLCAVTIPRCTDSSMNAGLHQGTDNVAAAPALRDISVNASRNPWIDESIQPGEWTELLPCIDLCYHVVQSCPPFLNFYCPEPDLRSIQYGYWQNGTASVNGTVYHFNINNPTCNRVGISPGLLTISHTSTLYCSFILYIVPLFTLLLLL